MVGFGVVKELAVDGEFGAEDVINLHHVFAEVEDIAKVGMS